MSNNKNEKKTSSLHPRNKHAGSYDLKALAEVYPELYSFVILNQYGNKSISFFDPGAVKALNKALLICYYNIENWDIPDNYLCPPIPGRADHIHYIADLLKHYGKDPINQNINVLDIGVGANCIYPIIGHAEYGWKFTGVDIDPLALKYAQKIIDTNIKLKNFIKLRLQNNPLHIFKGVIDKKNHFDISICNPPFHSSAEDASKATIRKIIGIKGIRGNAKSLLKPELNFGGQNNELWCDGGEISFITRMINESLSLIHI